MTAETDAELDILNPTGAPLASISPAQLLIDAGATDREIAAALGIDVEDVSRLPELAAGTADDSRTARVERALYARAVGYVRPAQRVLNNGQVIEYTETLDPDVGAARAWLQSRDPDRWADKRTQEFRVIVDRLGTGRVIDGEISQANSEGRADPRGLSRQDGGDGS